MRGHHKIFLPYIHMHRTFCNKDITHSCKLLFINHGAYSFKCSSLQPCNISIVLCHTRELLVPYYKKLPCQSLDLIVHYCRGLFGIPTAGWRNAPAYSLRGSTRGNAKLLGRSSSGARTQEHTSLESFGPPERNTLPPLCGVLHLYE